jgi:hypothetical protein
MTKGILVKSIVLFFIFLTEKCQLTLATSVVHVSKKLMKLCLWD